MTDWLCEPILSGWLPDMVWVGKGVPTPVLTFFHQAGSGLAPAPLSRTAKTI